MKNCVKRCNLKCLLHHGEAVSVDDEAIAAGMVAMCKACEEYDLDCTYNVDETGLF